MPEQDLDTRVKLAIYEITADTGRVPNSSDVARKIDIDKAEVLGSFGRLHAKRLLLPEPGGPLIITTFFGGATEDDLKNVCVMID